MREIARRIRYGGDYNPEQWRTSVWDDGIRLMQLANVTTVTVAVFAWAKLEPVPGTYDFGWLDDVLDRLHRGGIRVILATATASPPAWLAHRHPDGRARQCVALRQRRARGLRPPRGLHRDGRPWQPAG